MALASAQQRRASFARRAESLIERHSEDAAKIFRPGLVAVQTYLQNDVREILGECSVLYEESRIESVIFDEHHPERNVLILEGFLIFHHPQLLPLCQKYVINTDIHGELHVTVQGDLSQQDKRAVFMTVHDLGCNHNSFLEFVNSPSMTEIKERSCFIHVDVPGHEDGAPVLPDTYQFPSLQALGEDLVTVLDFLHVKYVIGLGEGAGANVLARFGLAHPTRCLGLVLINVTGSAASVLETFKNKFISWKANDSIAQSAEDFLMYHKFGHQLVGDNPDKEKIVSEYQNRLRGSLNSKNVGLFVKAFMSRKDLPLKACKLDILLITGMLSPYSSVVEKLYQSLDKEKVTMLKIERAGDVLADAPAKVAQSILLFCKGQGLLTSVIMPGVDRSRAFSTSSGGSGESPPSGRRLSRGLSMEDYDKPNIRRLSITVNSTESPNKVK